MQKTHYERVQEHFHKIPQIESLLNELIERKVSPSQWLMACMDAFRTTDIKKARQLRLEMTMTAFSFCAMRRLVKAVVPEGVAYYGDIIPNKDFSDWCLTLTRLIGDSAAQTNIDMLLHMINHESTQKRTYELTPTLAERLRDTVLRGMHTEDLRLPYPSIYICIPEAAGLKVYNDQTGWHKAEGAYVVDVPADKVVNHVDYTYDTRTGRTHEVEVREAAEHRQWRIMVVGQPANKKDNLDDALFYFSVELPKQSKLDHALKRLEEKRIECNDAALVSDLFRFLMNTVIYATWEEPGEEMFANAEARKLWSKINTLPEGSKKRANLIAKAGTINDGKRLVLGRNIVVSRSKAHAARLAEPTGRQISVRTLVSGHWRRYAVGVGRTERQWKWIEPFWRGPELGEQVANRHILT